MKLSIDEKDRKVLNILQEHGEYTTRQIAQKTLLPITTIHNRIKKLKKEGVIKRFTVDLDYQKLDKSFVAFVLISANIPLLKQRKKTQQDLAKELKQFSFVERVDIVSGITDIVVVVRVKDVAEFNTILFHKLQELEGVEKTQSLIVIHEEKS